MSLQNRQFRDNIQGIGYNIEPTVISEAGRTADPEYGLRELWRVIDNWGTGNCGNSSCGDFNGDGVVNVLDLLHILGGWGEPEPDPQSAQAPTSSKFSTSAQQRRGFNPSSLYRENTQLDESKLTLQEQKAGLDPEMLKQMVSKMGGAGKMGEMPPMPPMPKMGNGNGEGMPPMPKMGNGNGKGMPKLDPEMLKKLMAMMGKMGG